MRNLPSLIRSTVVFAILSANLSFLAAGPLLPPAGPVEATGPTGIFSLPFTIDQSGSYALRDDVSLESGDTGITITADNVTLDLGDHVMENGTGPGAIAIDLSGQRRGVTLRGGLLHGWTYYIDERAEGEADERVLIEDLRFEGLNGLQAPGGRAYTLRRCQFRTLGPGIVVGDMARVSDCDILGADGARAGAGIEAGKAAMIRDCRVEYGEDGIVASDHSTIRDVIVLEPSGNGIDAGNPVNGESPGNIRHAHVYKAGEKGITGGMVHGSTVVHTESTGINASSVFFSEAEATMPEGEGGTGIRASKSVMSSWGRGWDSGIIARANVSFSAGEGYGSKGISVRGIFDNIRFTSAGGNVAHSLGLGKDIGIDSESRGALVFNSMGQANAGISADIVGHSYAGGDEQNGITGKIVSYSLGTSGEEEGIQTESDLVVDEIIGGIIDSSYGSTNDDNPDGIDQFGIKSPLATGSLENGGKDVTHEYDMP